MKELSIEEKAKRYDEILVKLQEAKVDNNVCDDRYCCVIEDIVPELAEYEDEEIRKAMIKYFTNGKEYLSLTPYSREDYISWLEKQGEINEEILVLKDQIESLRAANIAIKETHKIELEKQGEQKPADDIERKYNPCYNMSFEEAQEYISNRGFDIPWTDCDVFVDFRYVTQTVANILRWADDNPKQKPAWSEEDDEMLDSIIEEVRYIGDFPDYPTKEEDELYDECLAKVEWLKSLKDRVQPQPKQEWSEEDEKVLDNILYILNQLKDTTPYKEDKTAKECIDKLKSLKERYTWKPSEEQMDALETAASSLQSTALESLYNDLKKL